MTRGAQNLYWKLLRAVAVKRCPSCSPQSINELMDLLHTFFKQLHNAGNTTTKMSPSEFHVYYETCQRDSILMFGVSGMDEDAKPFDHGFVEDNQ